MTDAASLVQRQWDAYNAQHLDAYVACYAADCVIASLNGADTETTRGVGLIARADFAK